MGKRYIRQAFRDTFVYQTDIDGLSPTIRTGFYVPSHLSGQPSSFFTDICALAKSFLDLDIAGGVEDTSPNVCSSVSTLTPRKVTFKFSNGRSFSLAFGDAQTLFTDIQDVVNYIGTTGGVTIECIDLDGERLPNVNGIFGVSFDPTQREVSGGVGLYYKGVINYSSDLNQQLQLPVKTLSQVPDSPPPIFDGIWDSCVGTFIDSRFACPINSTKGEAPNRHRRFIVDYVTENFQQNPEPEQRELPVAVGNLLTKRVEVRACGNAIAGNTSVYCLGYEGEKYYGLQNSGIVIPTL